MTWGDPAQEMVRYPVVEYVFDGAGNRYPDEAYGHGVVSSSVSVARRSIMRSSPSLEISVLAG